VHTGRIILKKLKATFYQRANVATIAKELLGKLVVTNFEDGTTMGRIVETEAYNGVGDKASHAYGGRRTNRTEIMYAAGGIAYVYLCYGIHHLFNIVTNTQDIPHAILVRAIEPVKGIELMMERMKKQQMDYSIGRGPGNVSKALGIATKHSGWSLMNDDIFIADDDTAIGKSQIIITTRIGVDYAEEDALLGYRFYIKDNQYVSGRKTTKN
jgi:DNA-3-methyladenine glycosylase